MSQDVEIITMPKNGLFGWITIHIEGLSPSVHNIPTADFRKHTESSTCWCNPVKDEEADLDGVDFYLHNPMDNRRDYEEYDDRGHLFLS